MLIFLTDPPSSLGSATPLCLGPIVVIDLTLAGDNALVIALAVRTLPRAAAVRGAACGARWRGGAASCSSSLVVTGLLGILLLQLAGGAPVDLDRHQAGPLSGGRRPGEGHVRHGTTLWGAVWIIIVADVVMSLDKRARGGRRPPRVISSLVALRDHPSRLPLVIWGSGVLARNDEPVGPWIIWIGCGHPRLRGGRDDPGGLLDRDWVGSYRLRRLAVLHAFFPLVLICGGRLVPPARLAWWPSGTPPEGAPAVSDDDRSFRRATARPPGAAPSVDMDVARPHQVECASTRKSSAR